MQFDSKREAKKFTEAEKAYFARRETRAIRRAARIIDPNSGFRLNVSPALAEKLRQSAARMQELAVQNQRQVAANKAVKPRDLAIPTKSVEAMHRRTGRI